MNELQRASRVRRDLGKGDSGDKCSDQANDWTSCFANWSKTNFRTYWSEQWTHDLRFKLIVLNPKL